MGTYKTIGILGGMGPGASADLYSKVISYMQNKYHAVQDSDFPPVLVYNLPVWGFDEKGFVYPQLVCKQLIDAAQYLEKAGVEVIAIACNTVHHFHDEIQAQVGIQVLNIITEAVSRVHERGYTKVGVLTSHSTRELGLYQQSLEGCAIEVVSALPRQQEIINQIIYRVMSGRQNQADILALKRIVLNYQTRGAQAVILGCTEIPLVFNQLYTDIPVFDATQVIAEQVVEASVTTQKMP